MHKCNCSPHAKGKKNPDAQCISKQQFCIPASFPSYIYREHDILWYGISFWPVWASCPGCALLAPCAPVRV